MLIFYCLWFKLTCKACKVGIQKWDGESDMQSYVQIQNWAPSLCKPLIPLVFLYATQASILISITETFSLAPLINVGNRKMWLLVLGKKMDIDRLEEIGV